ncbi:MAG: sigma 54-interacting transcriptional regulator, partial [Pyrinomonadaceae bacterium]
NKVIKADVRIIAATNRCLEQQVDAGLFREDLQARLEVCELYIPPLRERTEDIRLLVSYFAELDAAEEGREPVRFTEEALQVMEHYQWPRNVRELDNAVKACAVNCKDDLIEIGDLPERVLRGAPHVSNSKVQVGITQTKVACVMPLALCEQWSEAKHHLRSERLALAQQAIKDCGGNKTQAAMKIGISRKRLYEVLKESDSSLVENQSPQ